MQREYWLEKTGGSSASMERIKLYLRMHPEQEAGLRELLEEAERHYVHTQGRFAPRMVRVLMDEVESGKAQRIREAIEIAQEEKIHIFTALEKARQREARAQVEQQFAQSNWMARIKDADIQTAHALLEGFKSRQIEPGHVDAYVQGHPQTKTVGPMPALRELARFMAKREKEELAAVVEKIRQGQEPSRAWKEATGKARP